MRNWEKKSLGEICEIVNGSTPLRTNKDFWENGYFPWFTIDDIREQGRIITDTKQKVTKAALSKLRVLPIDTVLLCCTASVGEYAIAKIELTTNQQFNGLVVRDRKKLDPEFLMHYCSTLKDKLLGLSGKTTIDFIAISKLKTLEIPLPPLPEQQRIVSILDECFTAIDKAKANAEQNLKNAKELFESYLQGVFENGNWETKTIEAVCNEIFAGGDAPKNNFSLEPNEKHNIPIYANAVKDRGLYGYTDFSRVTKPCVTISARGSGTGHTELREESFLPIVRLIVCIPDTKLISNEFLKYTIDNLVIQRSGSAIPQLTVPMIKDYKIPVPTIEEQKIIIEKAEMLKEQKENLENVYLKKIEVLDELKKSILQKAFAGELKTEKAVAV